MLIMNPNQVLTRCYTTLLPTSPNYLSTHLTPSADLYGPFWTLSTLIFALFLSSSLAASITSYLNEPEDATEYNFQLLSIAVTVVYTYGLGLPALLWVALRYMGIGEWSIVEAVAVWGYGQFVWIPVAVSTMCVFIISSLNRAHLGSLRDPGLHFSISAHYHWIWHLWMVPRFKFIPNFIPGVQCSFTTGYI
jgi:hypothetical protein